MDKMKPGIRGDVQLKRGYIKYVLFNECRVTEGRGVKPFLFELSKFLSSIMTH